MAYLDQVSYGGTLYDVNDTKGRAMIAPKEESSTASAAHAAGTYFTYNDLLYRATAAIAVGGTITPGTNCVAVTVGGEMGELKDALDGFITDDYFQALTKTADVFATEEGYAATTYGKVPLEGYLLCTYTAEKDFYFYASDEMIARRRSTIISIYNGSISSANFVATYRLTADENTMPTVNSKAYIAKGQIFAVSVYTPTTNPGDFEIYANYELCRLNNNIVLNQNQIEQAIAGVAPGGTLDNDIALAQSQVDQTLASVIEDSQPFVALTKSSDVFTVVPDSYATTGNIVELAGYQLCYFTAPNDCSIYFDAETLARAGALFLSIYNTSIASGNNVVCYRRSDNNLPSEDSKAQVSAGQIIAISIYTPDSSPADFCAYCNYAKNKEFKTGIQLNEGQIEQVISELPPDGSKFANFAYEKKIAWFGDSISELKSLPHITGSLMGADVYDCSIRGSTIGITYSNYDKFAFYNLVTAIIAGDFTAQFDQLDAYERAQGHTYPGIRENLTTLSTLDFSTVDYVVLLQGTNDFGIQIYTVETDLSSASRNYTVNSYFCYNKQRYKVTAAITQGDAIVIGTNCELSVPKIDTMHELMDDAISRFITAYPRLKFYIISPPFRATPTEDQFGYSLADYIDVEKEVAEKYAIPFYNLLTNSRICDQNKTTYMLSDSGVYVHPNDYGDAWLAELCAKFISVD